MPRNLPRHLKNVDHGRASAHDPVEFQIAHQTLLDIMDSSPPLELFDQIVDGLLQPLALKGFWQIIISAVLDCFDRRVDGVKASQEDDIHAGILVQSLLEERQPVHRVHFQVTENDAALALTNISKALVRVSGSKTPIATTGKCVAEHLYRCNVVIDHAELHDWLSRILHSSFRAGGCVHGNGSGKMYAKRISRTVFQVLRSKGQVMAGC